MAEEIKRVEEKPNRLFVWVRNLVWELKWILLWIFVFAAAGIIIQSSRAGGIVFIDFFGGNFAEWINSFGNFSGTIGVSGYEALRGIIFRDWYYFLYAGGLISLAWGFIAFVLRTVLTNKREKTQQKTMLEMEERFEKGNR